MERLVGAGGSAMKYLKLFFVFSICALSVVLWLLNFLQSPLYKREMVEQQKYLNARYDELAPDLQEQRQLALDYWQRYPDVRKDGFWGEKGRLGIKGPADHYRYHGRREGRIFARVARPDDLDLEARLAEAYWKRNSDVAGSDVWGRTSALGILGPRDHYRFLGERQGRRWGE